MYICKGHLDTVLNIIYDALGLGRQSMNIHSMYTWVSLMEYTILSRGSHWIRQTLTRYVLWVCMGPPDEAFNILQMIPL